MAPPATPDEVQALLAANSLEALVPAFKERHVSGVDLAMMTQDELRTSTGITPEQAKQIKDLIATPEAQAESAAEAAAGKLEALAVTVTDGAATPAVTLEEASQVSELHRISSVCQSVPAGTETIQIQEDALARFIKLSDRISELEEEAVALNLPAAEQRLKHVEKQVAFQAKKVKEFQAHAVEQHNAVTELEGGKWYPGKYLMMVVDKHDGKVNEERMVLEAWHKKLDAAEVKLKELQKKQEEVHKEVEAMAAKCVELDTARHYCNVVLISAFGGAVSGDATENALEAEVAALTPRVKEVRGQKMVYERVMAQLKDGWAALNEAIDLITNTESFCSTTTGMADVRNKGQRRHAHELACQAALLAIGARGQIVDMPRVDRAKLLQLQEALAIDEKVWDSDNEIIRKEANKVRASMELMIQCKSDMHYAVCWTEELLRNRINPELRALEQKLAAKRKALQEVRVGLMRAWVEATGGKGAPASSGSGAPDQQHDRFV